MKSLTGYIDNAQTQAFQTIAGDRLQNLDLVYVLHIKMVLQSFASVAYSKESEHIEITGIRFQGISPKHISTRCLDALNGFPISQFDELMDAIGEIAYGNDD